jgi:ATP dependent DNA ligase domain
VNGGLKARLYAISSICIAYLPASSPPACPPKPRTRQPAKRGCTKSNMMVSGYRPKVGYRVKLYSRPSHPLSGHDDTVCFLYAFDLIELSGDDLRHDPLEVRKAALANVLAKAGDGIRLNEHIEEDGPTVFRHACKFGLEGIVSKRKDSALSQRPPS